VKYKGIILKIGFIDIDGNPINWTFDCQDIIPAIEIDNQGNKYFAGYSIDELRVISNEKYKN